MSNENVLVGSADGGGAGGQREGHANCLLVILVGAPGSGKSTFCEDVMRAVTSNRTWVRICQDSIGNGKAGTKIQCLKSAAAALKEGKSVFIDRCNLDREQRADFVKLGGLHVDVHAVVLDLPARLCISRSVKRSGHEGNLQGGKAAAVVNKMLQKKELPKLSEGFSRITFCSNEEDVRDTINVYCNLGPLENLPAGCFGQKSSDSKVQLDITKFLKKMDPLDSKPSDEKSFKDAKKKEEMQKDPMEVDPSNLGENNRVTEEGTVPINAAYKTIHTLAFPSISTSDFQFDIRKASDIIIESVSDFLKKVENVRLVFVDLSHGSNILYLVRSKAVKEKIDPKKFLTVVSDITRLSTEANVQCNVIANAANWRLKPGGGGVNAAIFKAAGEDLEVATRKCAEKLNPGNSVVVPLPSTSTLFRREGVTHVIHVLGPNMNPQRPNCLNNDYEKGCKILRDAYSSLFENFASIGRNSPLSMSDHLGSSRSTCKVPNVDLKMKRETLDGPKNNKKSKGDVDNVDRFIFRSDGSADTLTTSGPHKEESDELFVPAMSLQGNDTKERKSWGSWAQALHRIAMNPEQHKADTLEVTDDYVVLNDVYPKAKHHVLILARLYGLDRLSDVQREHLPLLKKMHSSGLRWATKFKTDDSTLLFRLGYHSVPSMRQLHLHVISQDFDSPHLKNKKHWNSFNTGFFRDSADVIEEIESRGFATINEETLLSTELRCHRCKSVHPNIPKLRSHISRCPASLPAGLLQNGLLVSSTSVSTVQ